MTVSIYNRSCYSLLQSVTKVSDLINYAIRNKHTAIGICEKNNLFSAMYFYSECKKHNIKPLIGMEIEINFADKVFPILLYPRNNSGYVELIKFTNNKDLFTLKEIVGLSSDILVIIPPDSFLLHLLQKNDSESVDKIISRLPDNFYVSIASNNKSNYLRYNEKLTYYIERYSKKALAIDLTLYPTEADMTAYKCLLAIDKSVDISDPTLFVRTLAYLKDESELNDLFDKKYLDNTDYFASLIDLRIDELKSELPAYKLEDKNISSKEYLYKLCLAGLNKRLNGKQNDIYLKRLKYELEVICKMNFQDYFLIIYDVILYCVRNDILVGPGRGSAVGCLVAYCLGITHIDPVKNDLYFERFLNPERISLPDIDIDFPDDKREEVIKHVSDKYGQDKVAHIITYNTFQSKAAIKEISKVLKSDQHYVDMLLSCITDPKDSLKEIYDKNKKFKSLVEATDKNKLLFDTALRVENLPRYTSLHAAGIVLSNKPLMDVVPVVEIGGETTVAYTMNYLEALGLIKIDFLALRNLTILKTIKDNIDTKLDLYKLPLDDEPTYALLRKGYSLGLFQLESRGMVKLLKDIQVKNFRELATLIALYRPGPMQNIEQYLSNRKKKEINYIHEDLKDILKDTYGIIVYQEQIMAISRKFASFTLGKADILRKAISKKNVELMNSLKNDFINGCLKNGYSKEVAEAIYQLIERFAAYGFNKAHSYGYAFISYIMAYLKAHYTSQFYCATLNSISGDRNKIISLISEAKQSGISFKKAHVNYSESSFTTEDKTIIFGLACLKDISKNISEKIIKDRNEKGIYINYFQFVGRATLLDISDKDIISLIEAGCLDDLGYNRATMINNLEETKRYTKLIYKVDGSFDESLAEKPLLDLYSTNKLNELEKEISYYGLSFDNSYLNTIRKKYPRCAYTTSDIRVDQSCCMILKIENVDVKKTKTGDKVAFVSASDEYGAIELVVFAKEYAQFAYLLVKDIIIYVEAKKSSKGNFIVSSIKRPEV